MRFLGRLHALSAVAIFAFLWFMWLLPSLHMRARVQEAWHGSSRRIVVFGDDWSDTGVRPVSAPLKSRRRDRDPDRGKLWVEALCEELACDVIDNFARSKPSNVGKATGPVVDGDVFANATAGKRNASLAMFDFKAQVHHFFDFEKLEKQRGPKGRRRKQEWTLNAVFFGIWDLLEYSILEHDTAVHATNRSIEKLFHSLDAIAEHVGQPIKVVVPKMLDIYWNTLLTRRAIQWGGGDIFVLDLNHIVMTQVRAQLLHSKHISDANGIGRQQPLFDEVETPCVALRHSGFNGTEVHAAAVDKCTDPTRHLFWDSLQLSGPAHQLIGQEAARLVRENSTFNNMDAREQVALQRTETPEEKDSQKKPSEFSLKFPPGY
ncbi:hypothetical protein EJ04DRAFT_558311 [Polyplosphaeria fusca]|uniref:Uncharacterized protein n=1 Tax=Polyplosphaeria fusca TaxID=682080 RepID=A0A9P4V8S9_9PLEO|nr:hypothetical protein EJ04DRAFT_558311 [Polyplosphaeria fusca]